jgi:ABC-type polysaccharide/polyol phosphate export permease
LSTSLESPLLGRSDVTAALRPAPAAAPAPLRDPAGVRVLGALERPSVGESIREVLAHRDLLVQLATRDVRIRYKQAVMGFAWAVLMPLLVVGAGTLVRVAIVTMTGVPLNKADVGSVVLKAFPWAFFSGALGFAVNSVTGNIGLVTKIYFPRAVLPIAAVGANMVDLGVGLLATCAVLPFLGAKLSFALLWAPVLVLLLVMLTAGLSVVLACGNLFFRDVKYIVQVVLTFGIFFTPVLFDVSTFGAKMSRVLMANPLAPLFEGLTLAVMRGHNLLEPLTVTMRGATFLAWHPVYLLYAALWAAGSLAAGVVLFQRTQYLFAEYA